MAVGKRSPNQIRSVPAVTRQGNLAAGRTVQPIHFGTQSAVPEGLARTRKPIQKQVSGNPVAKPSTPAQKRAGTREAAEPAAKTAH